MLLSNKLPNSFSKIKDFRPNLLTVATSILALFIALLIFSKINSLIDDASSLNLKDRIAAQNEVIRTIAQIFAGLFVMAGSYAAWKNVKASEKNVAVAQEGKITDRFSKAIEQLSSDEIITKLGGIYSLERIARDSKRDHQTVMEVLCAYVRTNTMQKDDENSTLTQLSVIKDSMIGELETELDILGCHDIGPERTRQDEYCWVVNKGEKARKYLTTDIQSALIVIGRRNFNFDDPEYEINLHSIDLLRVSLGKSNFNKANFSYSWMEGVIFIEANLERALFYKSNLRGAFFVKANLKLAYIEKVDAQGAIFTDADLKSSKIKTCNLIGTFFNRANLENSLFFGCSMKDSNFVEAKLKNAKFEETCLKDVLFDGANLEGTDFGSSTGLTIEQLLSAHTNKDTIVPDYLMEQWKSKT